MTVFVLAAIGECAKGIQTTNIRPSLKRCESLMFLPAYIALSRTKVNNDFIFAAISDKREEKPEGLSRRRVAGAGDGLPGNLSANHVKQWDNLRANATTVAAAAAAAANSPASRPASPKFDIAEGMPRFITT